VTSGSFAQLKQLHLPSNDLNGQLPSVQGGLADAQLIDFQFNHFSGELPPDWGSNSSFHALQQLYFNNNSFGGVLPASWGESGRFPALEALYLQGNSFSGEPPSFTLIDCNPLVPAHKLHHACIR
jgi:hypothetical protein